LLGHVGQSIATAAVEEDQTLRVRRIVAGKSRGWIRFSMLSAVRDVLIVRLHVPTCQATTAGIPSPDGVAPKIALITGGSLRFLLPSHRCIWRIAGIPTPLHPRDRVTLILPIRLVGHTYVSIESKIG
jgi:hypothetical protein